MGAERGIDLWINSVNEHIKPGLPKFLKPLLIHFFSHMEAEQQKEKE